MWEAWRERSLILKSSQENLLDEVLFTGNVTIRKRRRLVEKIIGLV